METKKLHRKLTFAVCGFGSAEELLHIRQLIQMNFVRRIVLRSVCQVEEIDE
jgi:hypothetical protein